ncbi:MAG: tol-pal system protein YbgF [Halioglobus sp.]|nr:tol-pal system protein YbgF [Halioglobus sp.]
MRSIANQWLTACGLVMVAGPLSFSALAQYVDLEAERAAAAAAGRGPAQSVTTAADPYGAQPAQAYPATSFGANNAPSASTVTPSASSGVGLAPTTSPRSTQAGSELGNMYLQLQQLQQEVMRLNGRVEELTHELNTLRDQSLQRYMDLDKRLGSGQIVVGPSAAAQGGATDTATTPSAAAPMNADQGVAPPGEEAAYRASYALVQGRRFEQAITAFKQFLQNYPDGEYAPNAHYWLGELYLVLEPPELESARQSFALLLSQYPQNSKAPDALYKLGKVQFLKGNREKAREYLDLVITRYQGSNDAVVKLAQDFIDQNY